MISSTSRQYEDIRRDFDIQTPLFRDQETTDNLVNITVGILVERAHEMDTPFNINRTVGLIEMAKNKTCAILQYVANVVSY